MLGFLVYFKENGLDLELKQEPEREKRKFISGARLGKRNNSAKLDGVVDPDLHGARASPETSPGATVLYPDSVDLKMTEKDGFCKIFKLENLKLSSVVYGEGKSILM